MSNTIVLRTQKMGRRRPFPPVLQSGADGRVIVPAKRHLLWSNGASTPIKSTEPTATQWAAGGVMQLFAGLGGLAGALGLGIAVLLACLAAGPLGWLAGLVLVPLAVVAGLGAGAVLGMIVGVVLLGGAVIYLAALAIQALS